MSIEFPVLEHSTYLNTAYVGLMPQGLLDFRAQQESKYWQMGDAYKIEAYEKLPLYHQNLGDYLHADPDHCYVVPNFSEGIRHLFDRLPKHFKVLSFLGDYHSLTAALNEYEFSCKKVPLGLQAETQLLEALRSEHFDVLVLSIVQYISGLKIDFNLLNQIKAEFPELLIIGDATQFLGTSEFNFEQSAFDGIVGSGYKWLLAGFGNGFCALKKDFFKRTQTQPNALNERIYAGHFDILAAASLDYAIRQLSPEVASKRYRAIDQLSRIFHQSFLENEWLLDPELGQRSPSSIFLLKGNQSIYDQLQNNNIRCSLRGEGVRISVHFYNSENDLDRLVEVLKKLPQPTAQIAT